MPTSKGNQPVSTFVKGLITEASPLTFPENASLDEINFKLINDGSRERRLGIDYEDDFRLHDVGVDLDKIKEATQSAFYWPSPSGSKKVDIGVIQVGRLLTFINLLTPNPSANILNGGAAINTGVSDGSAWQFAVINNYLLAVNPVLKKPYLLAYDDEADTLSYATGDILIRDLYGVDDGLNPGDRPTTLTETHKYNLRNQGWSSNIVSTCGSDAIDCTFSSLGVYPSNSDSWGIGRIGDLTDVDVNKYDPQLAKRNAVDIGQSPKGSYIIDMYDRGASRRLLTNLNVPMDRETTYASTVASYAGRAWYSGIQGKIVDADTRSPRLANAVIYSQIFRSASDLLKCYQEADPTSYVFNEVVDTDGGVIHIPEAVDIVRLKAIKQSLFVFAKNGVWEIRGGQDGFTATVFQVNKISSIGVYSPNSIIEADGVIYFWGIQGIYTIAPNPNMTGVWEVNNITYTTIQKYYDNIPDSVRRGAKGFFDATNNKLRWLFSKYTEDAPVPEIPVVISEDAEMLIGVTMLTSTKYIVATFLTWKFKWRFHLFEINADYSVTELTYLDVPITLAGKTMNYGSNSSVSRHLSKFGTSHVMVISSNLNDSSEALGLLVKVDLATNTLTNDNYFTSLFTSSKITTTGMVALEQSDTELYITTKGRFAADVSSAVGLVVIKATLNPYNTVTTTEHASVKFTNPSYPSVTSPPEHYIYYNNWGGWIGIAKTTDGTSNYFTGVFIADDGAPYLGESPVYKNTIIGARTSTPIGYKVLKVPGSGPILLFDSEWGTGIARTWTTIDNSYNIVVGGTQEIYADYFSNISPVYYLTDGVKERIVSLRNGALENSTSSSELYLEYYDTSFNRLSSKLLSDKTILETFTSTENVFPLFNIGNGNVIPYAYCKDGDGVLKSGVIVYNS